MLRSGKTVAKPVDLFRNKLITKDKSRKAVRLSKFLYLLLIVIAVFGIGFSYIKIQTALNNGLILPIRHIYIKGAKHISNFTIKKALHGRNASLLTLNRKSISKYLQKNSWFSSLTVIKRFPNTLILDVSERKPALVLLCNNKKWLVDTKGYRFKRIITHSERFLLPIVHASSCYDLKSNYNLYSRLLIVKKQLGKFISVKRIDIIGNAIYYESGKGPVVIVPVRMNIKLINKHIHKLSSFWKYYSRKNKIGNIDKISLVLNNQILIKWKVKHGG